VLCGQPEERHENFAKCLILLTCYMENGSLTPRGKKWAQDRGVNLIKHNPKDME